MSDILHAVAKRHRDPLDADLCRCIVALAPTFEARDHAPDTLPDILAHPGIVYAGGSDRTIYGDPHVNHAFRAWHDHVHAANLFDFTLAGEVATCEAQIAIMLRAFPLAPLCWSRIIRSEVICQAHYYEKTGQFPPDQVSFIRATLENDNEPSIG